MHVTRQHSEFENVEYPVTDQWRIKDLEKGVSDSATPTLTTPSFCNAESAEFFEYAQCSQLALRAPELQQVVMTKEQLATIWTVSLVSKLKGGFNGNLGNSPGSATADYRNNKQLTWACLGTSNEQAAVIP